MATDIVMPRLSDTMEEGRVLKWLKREGDAVKRGEPIAEIETDKANMELEAFDSGTMDKIVVQEGESVPVGQVIAYMKPAAAAAAVRPAAEARAPERREAAPPPPAAAPARPEAPPPPEAKPAEEEKIKASPLARRIARERGVDLSQVPGTGPEGRVTREDVLNFLKEMEEGRVAERAAAPPAPAARPTAPPAPPAPEVKAPAEAAIEGARVVEPTKMQATIAKRMANSKATVPHFYVTSEIDMTAASAFLDQANAALEDTVKISFTHLLVKALAIGLVKFPRVNASWVDGKFELHDRVNVGIAVDLPDGLIVPVVHDCQQKTLQEIAIEARQRVERVRSGHMSASDFEGRTFTVSNLGMFDVDEFAAIIDPPESAILAVGSIKATPSAVGQEITVRDVMKVTLSCDHRVFYGATAARFLQELKRLLESPMSLVL